MKSIYIHRHSAPLCLSLVILLATCKPADPDASKRLKISGATMGTTYNVRLQAKGIAARETELREKIQGELNRLDNLLSTWKPESEISRFNRLPGPGVMAVSPETELIMRGAFRIHTLTDRAFDPTLSELIELWGFGKKENKTPPPPANIQAALQRTGLGRLLALTKIPGGQAGLQKKADGVSINLSAIAKGYAVDVIARLLEKEKLRVYMVEIGGEVRVGDGKSATESWRIGVERPDYESMRRKLQRVLRLKNRAMATSGDYRNFFTAQGKRYAHILDPRTGRPAQTNVASASVVGPDCMSADALATALLVLPLERGLAIIDNLPDFEALFLVAQKDGGFKEVRSKGLERYLR